MKQICTESACTSCMACYSVCPVGAIQIGTDEFGFYRPKIDVNKCIGCKRCVHVCPVHGNIRKNPAASKAIAAYVKDKQLRAESTSGGAFSVFASYVLRQGGVIFGAAYDENFIVRHMWTTKEKDLGKFRSSKYVQSDIGNSFKQAKQFLDDGRKVLFSGTPCQINGLKQYLRKEYDNLILIDIVCHGTPTPTFFKEYLSDIEKRENAKIQSVRFRYKTKRYKQSGNDCLHNMKIMLCNNKNYISDKNADPYLIGFFSNLFLNPACYHCFFATKERVGDITIADFWGFKAPTLDWVNTGKGISLILLNNDKGQQIFNLISGKLKWCYRPLQEAINGNPHLSYPIKKGERYDEFWKDYRVNGYKYVEKKYFSPIPQPRKNIWGKCKELMPIHLKWIVKRMLGKA